MEERDLDIEAAVEMLLELDEDARRSVLLWFCGGCHRYVGPGDVCHCENDE